MAYVFSDTTATQDGLIQECEDICNLGATGISGNTARLKTFTRRINQAQDRFYAIAFKYDSLWNYDSAQQAELPIATTAINSGQTAYQFADELLQVTQVFAKDSTGVFHELSTQDDVSDPKAYTLRDSNGTPTTYELVGNSILLNPVPNYTAAAGLKVSFKRKATDFTYSQGAVPLHVPQIFFKYLANHASYPYLVEKSLKHANAVKQLILEDEAAIKDFISSRAKPKRSGLRVRQEDNR